MVTVRLPGRDVCRGGCRARQNVRTRSLRYGLALVAFDTVIAGGAAFVLSQLEARLTFLQVQKVKSGGRRISVRSARRCSVFTRRSTLHRSVQLHRPHYNHYYSYQLRCASQAFMCHCLRVRSPGMICAIHSLRSHYKQGAGSSSPPNPSEPPPEPPQGVLVGVR
jgi:hypothetical protein